MPARPLAVHDWLADLAKLIRNVDRLLTTEAKHGQAIEKLGIGVGKLKERVTRLEAREDVIIAEARSAASAAATQVAIASISDISRRIGRLEERSGRHRLDAPD